MAKKRKIFSYEKFLGLDKYHKPSEVDQRRSTDGYNFKLTGNTLKTRPALKMVDELSFILTTDDYLIDWYVYENVTIFITKLHIYIVDGSQAFNEVSGNADLITSNFSALNFAGKKPFFREEKEALFVFGLNTIYVFSMINNKYILYDLRYKPANPFIGNETYEQAYEDLPIPYEPKVMIGEESFEDVNLLSPVSRYEIFVGTSDNEEGKTKYFLPTHYDEDKHDGYEAEFTFYKDKFSYQDYFPIFLGKQGENFDDLPTPATILDDIIVGDKFYPKKEFEYLSDGVDGDEVLTVISETLDISKKDFFELRIENSETTTFEYLMDYIINNHSTLSGDYLAKFIVPIEYDAIIKRNDTGLIHSRLTAAELVAGLLIADNETKVYRVTEVFTTDVNFLEGAGNTYPEGTKVSVVEDGVGVYKFNVVTDEETIPYTVRVETKRTNVNIYVHIKNSEFESANLTAEEIYESTVTNDYEPFDDVYPSVFQPTAIHTLYLNNDEGILNQNYSQEIFKSLARSAVLQNISSYANAESVRVFGKFYKEITYSTDDEVSTWGYQEWFYSTIAEDGEFTWDDEGSMPAYPTFDDGGKDILQLSLISTSGEEFDYTDNGVIAQSVRSQVENRMNELTGDSGYAYAKVKVQTYYLDNGQSYERAQALVIPFSYTKSTSTTYRQKQSFSYRTVISIQDGVINTNLYDISYDERKKAFIVVLRDYFFDYNNEPAVDVKITFNSNPDFEKISKNTFGINFGAENRLFIAGDPNYPNIDRYNVSNDLLGDNVKNQSYELTYFPSKNFRVVGGRGAINGYIVATDNLLYITKEDYSNDQKFFLRQRSLQDDGGINYIDYKTSANITPLNERCLARFNNDIVILSENGLFGINISKNLLTDERLVEERAYLINEEIKEEIANVGKDNVFIKEDNLNLYLFIGNKCFVADSRYGFENEKGNLSYEMVKWLFDFSPINGRYIDGKLNLIDDKGQFFYNFVTQNKDEYFNHHTSVISKNDLDASNNIFYLPNTFDYIFDEPEKYAFRLYEGYKKLAVKDTDYHFDGNNDIIIDNAVAFRDVEDGDTLYYLDGTYNSFTVDGLEASDYTKITGVGTVINSLLLYQDITDQDLFISLIAEDENGDYDFRLSLYEPESIISLTQNENGTETVGEFTTRILENVTDYNDYYFESGTLHDIRLNYTQKVEAVWFGNITSFSDLTSEKTMFKTTLYVTKQLESNEIKFGYKTLRRLKALSDTENIYVSNKENVDVSGRFNFDELDYKLYSLATFNDVALTFPTKERNFLHIQFAIIAYGDVELNAIRIIYKSNRLLKTIS